MGLALVLERMGVPHGALYGPSSNVTPDNTVINYIPPPKSLPGFPGAKRVPNRGRARWKNPDGKTLEWDSQHGDVEVYDKNGKHLGSADPDSGEMTKPRVKGRTNDK